MSLVLPSYYLAPISYYAHLCQHGGCIIDVCEHYQKQTYRNRCTIATPNGPLSLTIPVVKPEWGHSRMRDIRISDHGNWRHQHWNALVSAYNQTPFFEYYADDFAPFYEQRWDFLVDYNEGLQHLVCSQLGISAQWTHSETYLGISPSESLPVRPYYQLFRDRNGFLPNLSIVDLLFNLGPESLLYLQ